MDKERDGLIRHFLLENNIGAIIFWRPEELVMATGYYPLWGLSFCLYPDYGEPIVYVPALEPKDQLPNGFLIKEFEWGKLNVVNPWAGLYQMVQQDLCTLNPNKLPITFQKTASQSSLSQIAAEEPALPLDLIENLIQISEGGFKNYDNEIVELFVIKTVLEIERIKLANKIAVTGLECFYRNIRVGLTEVELSSLVESKIQSQTGNSGVRYAKAWAFVMSGINSIFGGTFGRNSGRRLENGDIVLLELAVCVNGYWSDLTRVGTIGDICEEKQHIFSVVKSAYNLALGLVKSGSNAGEIDRKVREYITHNGFGEYYQHALGHHVGFRYHDYGQSLRPNSELILKEGMVITIEPGIYVPEIEVGVSMEDNVLVKKNGYEILSRHPIDLY